MRVTLQILPIILAVIALISCAEKLYVERRLISRITLILASICSLILIMAQVSWYVSFTIEGSLQGTWFANILWDIFNSLTMVTFIAFTIWRKPNVEESTASRVEDN